MEMISISLGPQTRQVWPIFPIAAIAAGELWAMPRPPGPPYLIEALSGLRDQGIDVLLSLQEPEESISCELDGVADLCAGLDLSYRNFPIRDHSVPSDPQKLRQIAVEILAELSQGKKVAVHCYAGIGRTSIMCAAILLASGVEYVDQALIQICRGRQEKVPDTLEQIQWLHAHSGTLSGE